MKKLTTILLLVLTIHGYGQESPTFEEVLALSDMSFKPLENFEEIPVLPNSVMEYEYAAKNKETGMEVRYAIRPINVPYEFEDEEERLDFLNSVEVENTQYKMFTMVATLNLSGGKEKKITEFSEAGTKSIGADWVGTVFTVLDSDFAKGYQFCMLIVLFKKDGAICYCYFLTNDVVAAVMESYGLAQNLRFN